MANKKQANKSQKKQEEVDLREVVSLKFDDKTTVDCFIEGVFGVDGQDYIALQPDDDSGDIYIYKYIEDPDFEYHIEEETDDAKFEAAVRAYEKIVRYKPKKK